MDDNRQLSRSYRQAKRRRNQRIMYSFILLAILFFVILLILIFTGSSDDKQNDSNNGETEEVIADASNDDFDEANNNDNEIEEEVNQNNENEQEQEIVIQYIDSDDDNVIEAYVGNWPPMGTVQEEPHITDFTKDSIDWIEMREAVLFATNISEDDLVELWFGNGGEQKVIATVKNRSTDEIYRVYLSWVEESGWQPTRVEKLKEYIPS